MTRARQWRGTSCEHAIAAARGGTRVGRGRACGLWVWPRRDARAGVLPVKTPARTSLSLLPQPPSSSATDAPQPMFVPPGCFWQRARSRSRFSQQRDGCPLMSAACYSPRLLLRASLRGGARTHKGQPRLGAKHSGWFPTSAAATLCWGEVLWLLPRLERALTAPLVAYRTLANRFAGCMTSNAAIGYDRLPEVAWHRIVAATVAGLHLEAKLLHSGSVNLHSVALFASNPRTSSYGSVSVACGSSNVVGSVVLAGAAARARPNCRRAAAVTDCG